MKTTRILMLSIALCLANATTTTASLILRFEPAGESLRLIFDSQSGTNYQMQVSTNLSHWDAWGTMMPGDGLSKTQSVSTGSQRMAFFRVSASQSTASSPSDAEFTAIVVGKTMLDYTFLNATRFSWNGEFGNWDYTKTGGTTGKLVFTYDEDNNDPAVYREEIILTFTTATQGTYRYSEFYSGSENPGSIATGNFDLAGP